MTREEAKELFRSDIDAYGKPRKVMGKINDIYDEFEVLATKIMNLGMTSRQSQLNFSEQRSGNEILEEFLKDKL